MYAWIDTLYNKTGVFTLASEARVVGMKFDKKMMHVKVFLLEIQMYMLDILNVGQVLLVFYHVVHQMYADLTFVKYLG